MLIDEKMNELDVLDWMNSTPPEDLALIFIELIKGRYSTYDLEKDILEHKNEGGILK